MGTLAYIEALELSIVDEWDKVHPPPPPELGEVTVESGKTSFLILDIQYRNCNPERRPRCTATLPSIQRLLRRCRHGGLRVVYSTTRGSDASDIRSEVAPLEGERIVSSGVDKFHGTDLEGILEEQAVDTVIIAGTSAHGAVLHTATAAALRGLQVIIPVDCISASEAYAEQYTVWHLANAPGSRRSLLISRSDMITLR
jgi:nicotinamidase-related amidase